MIKYNSGAAYLTENDWNRTSACLAPLVSQFEELADKTNLSVLYGKRWPQLQLSSKQGRVIRSLKLCLNRDYMLTKELFFELVYEKLDKGQGTNRFTSTLEMLGKFTIGDLKSVSYVMGKVDQELVRLKSSHIEE